MKIRSANTLDLRYISHIERNSYDSPLPTHLLHHYLRYFQFDVITIDCIIAGYGIVMNMYGESRLVNLTVDNYYRNQGLGRKLLGHLEHNHVDNEFLLDVNIKNKVAIKLYKSYGFKSIGMRKKYYDNTHDAIVMSKVKPIINHKLDWLYLNVV